MFKTMLMGMMILALTSIAASQSSDYKPLEFFAGYSHNQIDTGIRNDDPALGDIFGNSESFHGLETSVTISRYVGLKFDFSAHFRLATRRRSSDSTSSQSLTTTDFRCARYSKTRRT